MKSEDITPYRLTIIGAVVVLCLSVVVLTLFGGPQNAAPYLSLIGSIAIPALLSLWRAEGNSQQMSELKHQQASLHAENQVRLQSVADGQTKQIQELADALSKLKGGM